MSRPLHTERLLRAREAGRERVVFSAEEIAANLERMEG